MDRLVHLSARAFLAFLFCTPALAAQRSDVLVIVNDNSRDSPQLGTYYAQQRGVIPSNVVHVKVVNQYYIDWSQFTALRDQILRQGICPTIAPNSRPMACSDTSQAIYTQANIDTLTALTPIKYIVTTRGVPSKVSTYPLQPFGGYSGESTSVDNYLRLWLAEFYQRDVMRAPVQRGILFDDGRGLRTVTPAIDREYIVGRIDGVDLPSAVALVDRAIRTEVNGLYGNLFASTFGNSRGQFQWTNYRSNQPVYQIGDGTLDYWRYAFGLLGENRSECADYNNPDNYLFRKQNIKGTQNVQADGSVSDITGGNSPTYCMVQFNKGNPNEAIPGVSYSRQPLAMNAIGYFGSLDGQTIEDGFSTLLHWRKSFTCAARCTDDTDPDVCRANSTDPYQEINTDCVGVADGFIGYNFQSYPLSIFGVWPTHWESLTIDYNDTPLIRKNDGQDDLYSIWFENPDDLSGTSQQRVGIQQRILLAAASSTAKTYRLSFYVKGENASFASNIPSGLRARYKWDGSVANPECPDAPNYSLDGNDCIYADMVGNIDKAVPSAWTLIPRDILVPAIPGWKNTDIYIQIGRGGATLAPGAAMGFDSVSLMSTNDPTSLELVSNGKFNQGHEQTSQGDFAANFLSRLGGTAFWGSLSHHGSGGFSFGRSSLGTLVYFMKGLPLGDAVWVGNEFNDGDLYGDPLFSPIAVRINNPSNNIWNFVPQGPLNITGSARNGRDESFVLTAYSVEYCAGSDFFLCDRGNTWIPTGISGAGLVDNALLGTWDTAQLPTGQYTIRLSVTSSNARNGKQQTFHDYLPVITYDLTSDVDGDGVKDIDKAKQGVTPTPNKDTDGDGLPDDAETYIYHTNPNSSDMDGDGLSDWAEVLIEHTDVRSPDTDGDGLTDGEEVLSYRSNPLISDTDGDKLTDGEEVKITLTDPLNKYSRMSNVLDGDIDPFGDGVGYSAKLSCGLDIAKSQQGLDSDTDGMDDLAECLVARNPYVNEPAVIVPNILYMMGF